MCVNVADCGTKFTEVAIRTLEGHIGNSSGGELSRPSLWEASCDGPLQE